MADPKDQKSPVQTKAAASEKASDKATEASEETDNQNVTSIATRKLARELKPKSDFTDKHAGNIVTSGGGIARPR